MNISVLLNKCARIERLVADLYYLFMKQHSDNPELAALWRKTALEEENHEQQFMLAKRLSRSQEVVIEATVETLDSIINNVVALLAKVAAEPPVPREALRLAIVLEEKLSEYHLDKALIFSDDSLNRLFKSMMNNDSEHVEKLKEAYAVFDEAQV